MLADIDYEKICQVCGGTRVMIRGKYPDNPRRNVCPTCMLEMIENLFDNEAFGIKQAMQDKEPL